MKIKWIVNQKNLHVNKRKMWKKTQTQKQIKLHDVFFWMWNTEK